MKKRLWTSAVLALGILGCTGNPMGTQSNPYGLPRAVSLTMPDSLKTVSAYRVQSSEAFSLAEQIGANLEIYVAATETIEEILAELADLNLQSGEPRTFTDDGETYTALLEVKADHALISIGEGGSAKGEQQIIGISYTSPKKGRAVFRSLTPMEDVGRFALETRFDLDAGEVTANGYSDTRMLSDEEPELFNARWEFKQIPKPPAGGAAFTLRTSAFFHMANSPEESGIYALVANCLPDGSAAAILGVQTPESGADVTLLPSDAQTQDVAFFLGADGQDIRPSAARQELRQIVPSASTIYRPFPADPSQTDMLAEAPFQFPR